MPSFTALAVLFPDCQKLTYVKQQNVALPLPNISISDLKSKEDKLVSIQKAYRELSLMVWGVTWQKKVEMKDETGAAIEMKDKTGAAICNGIFSSDNCGTEQDGNKMDPTCLEQRTLALEVSFRIVQISHYGRDL